MEQLVRFLNSLNSKQRIVIIGGFSLLFVVLVGLLIWTNVKSKSEEFNYTIASNLTKNQILLASNELETSGIPFLVMGNGDDLTLRTTKEFVNIAKIKLVTSEAATNTHKGWELFEKSSLGTTNFENQVKYLRALEGELSRSLESLSGVLRASVKIAIPKETIFTQRKTPPTASAVLTIKPGLYLTQKQIDGIRNFVASAVPSLTSENIKLIDQDGSLLEHSKSEIDNTRVKAQNKYKEGFEKDLESKIIDLLEPIVGIGKVVARISVDLNFVKSNVYEEVYDPEGTIRSQQTSENTLSATGVEKQTGGIPGAQSNIQSPEEGGGAGVQNSSSQEEAKNIINYEISKKIINSEDIGFASLKRITAAVTFDSTVLESVQNKEEYIASISSVVQDTIGYNKERGDNVTVRDFKFLTQQQTNQGVLVDESGNIIETSNNTLGYVRAVFKEYSDYIQYIIVAILLFIFYKRFIGKNDILILPDGRKVDEDGNPIDNDDLIKNYEDQFDRETAHGRLKAKIRSQLLNNIEGLDEEGSAKYEVLIDEIDKIVGTKPDEIAAMLEVILNDSSGRNKLREVARQKKG